MADWVEMNQQLLQGNAPLVKQITEYALKEGFPPETVLENGLTSGTRLVGEDFRYNRLYVHKFLTVAGAMRVGIAVLKPFPCARESVLDVGTLTIGASLTTLVRSCLP